MTISDALAAQGGVLLGASFVAVIAGAFVAIEEPRASRPFFWVAGAVFAASIGSFVAAAWSGVIS